MYTNQSHQINKKVLIYRRNIVWYLTYTEGYVEPAEEAGNRRQCAQGRHTAELALHRRRGRFYHLRTQVEALWEAS